MPRRLLFPLSLLLLAAPVGANAQDLDFAPINVQDSEESKAELEEALRAYKKRDFLRSSLVLYRIVSRNEQAISAVEQKAEYTLGKTLYRLGLFQASLNFFDRIVQSGRDHRYFKATCKWLYYLSRKLSGDPGLLEKISVYEPSDCPAEFRDELSYLVGQYHYKQGAMETSLRHLATVTPGSGFFPKAKFLEGIAHVRMEQPKPAVESFKDLLRVTAQSDNPTEDLKYFNQLAKLSMARVFYSTGQDPTAVKYYDQVPLDSPWWLDALFESSWAFFRMDNHQKSLGNLHTLNSPFFRDEYYPEAQILSAVIYYSNCKYEQARDTINEFRLSNEPLRDEIQGYLDSYADPSEFYEFLERLEKSGSAVSPRVSQILSAAFQDKGLRRIAAYVKELDRELELIRRSKSNWSRSQLASLIVQELEVIKSLAVHEAGRLAKERLKRVVTELNDLISQALKIEFEIASAEKGLANANLSGAAVGQAPTDDQPLYATDDEHIYWPFEGEYWRDELGYYLYTIKSECRR